jgi:hypothetical protein
MVAVLTPSVPAWWSSMRMASCGVSARLFVRGRRNSGRAAAASMRRSRADASASGPRPPRSCRNNCTPALPPSPRTVGGCTTKMLASRTRRPSSRLKRSARAAAPWLAAGRTDQSFRLMKPWPEPWSPPAPRTRLKNCTSGCSAEVGLDALHHTLEPFGRGARRHANLDLQAALVLVGQEAGGQRLVQPGRAGHEQQEHHEAACTARRQPAHLADITFGEAVEAAVEATEQTVQQRPERAPVRWHAHP